MKPKVYIIILNWNNWEDTIECLHSVFAMDYSNFEVIVIDNASENESVSMIRFAFPDLKLIENNENKGFTGGNNQGINIAMAEGTDYVWLLNNDTVVEIDTLSNLVASAERSLEIGMVSPAIYYYDAQDTTQFCGSFVDWDNLEIRYPSSYDIDSEYVDGPRVCLWGTALLIKKSLINKIGVLREDYFAYYEDTEYSLRTLCNGFKNKLELNAKIFHKTPPPSSNSKTRSTFYYYYMVRNKYFMWKDISHTYKISSFKIYKQLMVNGLTKAENFKSKGLPIHSHSCIEGVFHALMGKRGKQPDKTIVPFFLVKLILGYPYLLINILVLDFYALKKQLINKFVNKYTQHGSSD